MKRILWILFALLLFTGTILFLAYFQQPENVTLDMSTTAEGQDVDIEKIYTHLKTIADAPSRITGSPGEQKARNYILHYLRSLGITDITQQTFSVAVPVTSHASLKMKNEQGASQTIPVYPLWPNLARTCQTPPEGLSGALVDGGDGSEEEMKGIKLRDALVVLDWDSDLAWLSVPEFGGKAIVFRGDSSASRTVTHRKYLTIPADIPRYYVAAEDVPVLDSFLASNPTAKVQCDVQWQKVESANVLAKVCEGTTTTNSIEEDNAPLIFHAYYDSISIVPGQAPGAEQACGAATLLELTRHLRTLTPARPVYVLFTSGHGQALAGITHFVHAIREGDIFRPGLMVALDLSSRSSFYGIFALGGFRAQNEAFFTHKYSTIGRELIAISDTYTQNDDTNMQFTSAFVDGINSAGTGRGWWTYFPYISAMEGEMANLSGIPSVNFATINDSRSLFDTPDDLLEHVDTNTLARQISDCNGTEAGIVRLAAALTRWKGPFVTSPVDDNWSSVAGRAVWLDQKKDYAPNQPLRNALVFLKQSDGAKYFCGTRGIPCAITDENGHYEIYGLRKLNAIDMYQNSPPEGTLEAYATATENFIAANSNAVATYCEMASKNTDSSNAASTNTATDAANNTFRLIEDGSIIYALDMARSDDYPWTFRAMGSEAHRNLVLFPCSTVTLTGLTDPRSYVTLSDVKVLESATKSSPYQYGLSMSDLAGGDASENVATIWTEPALRIMLTGGVGFQGRRLILINNSPENPEGEGFVLSDLKTLPSMVLQCARDMWNINAARIKKLATHGVTNPRVDAHHKESKELLEKAEKALEDYDYAEYRIAAERSWAAAGQAYAETLSMVNNMIHGVLFYLALLLPLSYCLERLLVSSETINSRITWIGIIFAASFAVLALVHPAFRFTMTPFLVLLAFIIVALVTTVAILIVGRVDALLQAQKQAAGGRHEDQYRRTGVAVRALDLGMSNIRRRPQRGFLTGLSVVVVTFILLSFTSLIPAVSISRLTHPRGTATYRGLLSRDRSWNPLPEPLCSSLRRTYASVSNSAVAVRGWFYSDNVGQLSVIDLHAKKTQRNTTVSALSCLEPEEAFITRVTNALIAGRWFKEKDEASIILSEHTAKQMGLTTNDIGSPIRLYSKDLPLIGIVDGAKFDRIYDLDGEPLTPVNMIMQRAKEAQRAQGGNTQKRADTLDEYVHYSMDQIAIVPLWLGIELRGGPRSIGVKLPPAIETDDEAAGYARRSSLTILGSDGESVTLYAALNTSQLSAAWQIAIPIILAAIMILATMMGSVYERRSEINVYNSVGLSPNNVAMLFVAESAVYAIVGAGTGYLLGQVTAKVLHTTGWLSGVTLNYTAGSAIFVTVISMLIVVLSAIYPARQAFVAAMPDVEKEQDADAKEGEDAQDSLSIWLPFVATPEHIYAMQAYLHEFLDSVQGVTIGTLAVDNLMPELRTENGKPSPVLTFRAWLSPFDLGVSHDTELAIIWREEHGIYQYHLRAKRYSGDRQNWHRLTPRFIQTLRKQLLMWRIHTNEEQQAYENAGSRMYSQEKSTT